VFGSTISRTYIDSLDCPELNDVREIEDVIAGHKAVGRHDPSMWFLMCDHEHPCGVLLLSPTMQLGAVELVYLGVTPEFRGQRVGDALVHHALATAFARGFERLFVAVDSRNVPAIGLYLRHGLRHAGQRRAFMRDLRGDRGLSSAGVQHRGGAVR
jgi:ribosomal protein S18 acetylase RimI-like enzyme